METLKGKVFLIVDAGSEVGQMVAKTFAKYSANLSLCGSVDDSFVLNGLASECSARGSTRVITVEMKDANNSREIEGAVKRTLDEFGYLHGLVYLVDQVLTKTFHETTLDDLNRLHTSHVESPLLWVQTSLPHLKATKGNVVLLSSGQSQNSAVGVFPYALTKAAEDHLVRTMALDLAAYGIRVNSICPTYPNNESDGCNKQRQNIISSLSEYIAYLSTDMATCITGQCVAVGNGFTVENPTNVS